MAKWTNYYKIIDTQPSKESIYTNQDMTDAGTYSNFSWYQKIVQGSFSRFARYREYDIMDKDVEVSRALDTIAEEMTGNNPKTNEPIEVRLLTQDETKVKSYDVLTVKAALRKWNKIHKWDNKLFKIARLTVKYGDCFFRKRSYHSKWEFIHPKNVVAAIVDTDDVNNILAWQVKAETNKTTASGLNLQMTIGKPQEDYNEIIPANEIVRFTLNDDMSDTAPFGESILAPVFKTHKQKELLEDAIIIYRVQRSPERRVFYIDVGKMPPQRVKTYLETIKNEIKQKKIPTMNGGQNEVDSVYNPHSMCLALDTKIPLLDGRTVTLSTMIDEYNNGKQNWVYSINPKDGNIVPGIVSWAGITQQNVDTIKLTLDNGETIICTPEHKFPVQGKGFIEAKDLTPNDSLFPFNTDIIGNFNTDNTINESCNVINIEICEKQDVGTLTIDKDEIYHNYHTFALTNCFTRNSEDFFFACLSMKTKVYLLDGRTLTIDELRQEYEEGKENWTYSVDQQTGKLIAGKIDWAGYTRKNAEMVRVLLDNDIPIDCTPDHKFVLDDGTEVEAQFLTPETSLMPMHTNIIHECGCSDKFIQQKIISVTWLDEREDTGCLHVIDENNNHNFALEAGVYVKNSRPDGRGSRVETLPGGANLGQLEDLDYFQRKVWRGLKVPASYMIEQSEGGSLWNDGKVGIAYIQELRFALFIMRLQGYIETELDAEFKLFLRNVGITIDENLYELSLPEPSNFGKYKQLELDGQIVSQYGSIDSIPYISKRFALKRYMKLTDQEIVLNERMLREERNMDVNGDAKDYPAIYGQMEDGMGAAGGMGGMGGMGAGGMGAPMDMGGDLSDLPADEGSVEGVVPAEPTEKI
jgi:hypothetical protein